MHTEFGATICIRFEMEMHFVSERNTRLDQYCPKSIIHTPKEIELHISTTAKLLPVFLFFAEPLILPALYNGEVGVINSKATRGQECKCSVFGEFIDVVKENATYISNASILMILVAPVYQPGELIENLPIPRHS